MDFSQFQSTLEQHQALVINKFTEMRDHLGRLDSRMDQYEALQRRPVLGKAGGPEFQLANYETPGARFVKSADLDLFRKTGRLRFELKDGLWPAFEQKTLIDSAALGFSTPGVLGSERIEPSIVGLPKRRLTVRDLLRSRPIGAAQIDWIREDTFSNAASPQSEGNAKAESGNTFSIASERVRTLAHWVPVTRQVLDDAPELQRFLNENLLWGLKLIEEFELLFGDASGDHLDGLCHQAGAYLHTYAAAGDSKLDTLRHAILELETADEDCTAFVLNPKDWHDLELVKEEAGGSNKGSYVIGDPLGSTLRVPTVWRRPVVSTNAIPAGRFLCGNFANAIVGDRQGASIELSQEHADFFTSNKIALRCEERISLAVLRPGAFRYGTL